MDNSNGMTGAETAPGESARRVKDAAETVIDRTKQIAGEQVERGAERAVGSAQTAASALRRAAEEVQGEHAWIGTALLKSADGLDAASQSLAGGDVNRALNELGGFARRQPALFLGTSLALGFALARVGKTAIEQSGVRPQNDGYDPLPGM
jgi:hypothetical protein